MALSFHSQHLFSPSPRQSPVQRSLLQFHQTFDPNIAPFSSVALSLASSILTTVMYSSVDPSFPCSFLPALSSQSYRYHVLLYLAHFFASRSGTCNAVILAEADTRPLMRTRRSNSPRSPYSAPTIANLRFVSVRSNCPNPRSLLTWTRLPRYYLIILAQATNHLFAYCWPRVERANHRLRAGTLMPSLPLRVKEEGRQEK